MNWFLLQNGEDGYGRLLFALIFILIWAISAIVSAINKKQQERRRREQQEVEFEIEPPMRVERPPPREAPPRMERPAPPPRRIDPAHRRVEAPPRRVEPPHQRVEPLQRREPRAVPPPLPTARQEVPRPRPVPQAPPATKRHFPTARKARPVRMPERAFPTPRVPVTHTETADVMGRTEIGGDAEQSASRAAPAPSARVLQHVLTPQSLRSHYILTEILQPPLAIRSLREWD